MTVPLGARLEGVVASFDDHAGLGEIEAASGARYWFHCTRIADGSRHVDPGRQVTFRVVPGHHGRWEAAEIAPTSY